MCEDMTCPASVPCPPFSLSSARYLASILEVDEDDQDLLVHFEGWNQRHDEWIDFESDRLRPLTPTTAQQFNPIKWVRIILCG